MSVIGATALQQLTHTNAVNAACHRVAQFVGGKDIRFSGPSAEFRWAARAKNGANFIKITLDPSDTYTVEFWYRRGASMTYKGKFSDQYAEDLKPLFERETALYLSLR